MLVADETSSAVFDHAGWVPDSRAALLVQKRPPKMLPILSHASSAKYKKIYKNVRLLWRVVRNFIWNDRDGALSPCLTRDKTANFSALIFRPLFRFDPAI